LNKLFGEHPGLFAACLFVWSLTNMDQALFGYAIPGILAEFGLPLSAVGTVLSISFMATAGIVILAGVAADRYGRAPVLGVLLMTSAVAVGFQGFAGGLLALTVCRALGFGLSGGLSPITNALVVENAAPRYRGIAMGLLQCGYPLGWFAASLAAAPLLAHHGWRAACFIAFLVAPLGIPIAALLRRYRVDLRRGEHAPPTAVSRRNPVRTLFRAPLRRTTLASMAMFFLFGGAYAGSAFFFPTFFTQSRGYSEADAATLVGLSNGIAVFGYMGAAMVGEFLTTRRTVYVVWCLGGALALSGLLWLSHTRTADLLWYGATAALFFGSQAVVQAWVAELFPTSIRTTALALCISAPISLGLASFPLLVPAAVTRLGWRVGLTAVVIPVLVLSGLVALSLPNRHSGQSIQ
jgi:MFS family permease